MNHWPVRVVLLPAMALFAAGAQSGPYARWAVIASPELAAAGWVDLLTAELAAQAGLQLVEREAIAAATRELAVANMLGAEAAGERLKLGRLLKADALLLLSVDKRGEEQLLRVVVSDARCGARLGIELWPYSLNAPGAAVEELTRLVAQLRGRYPNGLSRVLGVPAFVSKNLVHDYDNLEDELAAVLSAGLAAYPGTAVVETEEAEAIQRELALSGTALERRMVPVFVRGEYRVAEGGAQRGSIRLSMRVTGGDGPERNLERELADVPAAVAYLRTDVPRELIPPTASEAGPSLSAEQQAALLLAQSDAFRRLGELRRPIGLREAALLLKPDDVAVAKQIVEECVLIVPYARSVAWENVPPEKAIRSWYDHTRYWRRGLELLEWLIRRRAISQDQALLLHRQLGGFAGGLL